MKKYDKSESNKVTTVDYLKNEFLNALKSENGKGFWDRGWKCIRQERNTSGKKYQGINAFYLSLVASRNNYEDNRWFTSAQINTMNKNNKDKEKPFIHIKKGEKASYVEYPFNFLVKGHLSKEEFEEKLKIANDVLDRPIKTKNGFYNNTFTYDQMRKIILITDLKSTDFWMDYKDYAVFNGQQIEGIETPKIFNEININKIKLAQDVVDRYLKNEKIKLKYVLNKSAAYSVDLDFIRIPPKGTFKDEENYISTLIHEICHSTGHKKRLDRSELLDGNSSSENKEIFDKYCVEELNAEIAATLLCNELGVSMSEEHINNHLRYVKYWAECISDEKGESLLRFSINKAYNIIEFIKEKGEYEKALHSQQKEPTIEWLIEEINNQQWNIKTHNIRDLLNVNLCKMMNDGLIYKGDNLELLLPNRNKALIIYNGKIYENKYTHVDALLDAYRDNHILHDNVLDKNFVYKDNNQTDNNLNNLENTENNIMYQNDKKLKNGIYMMNTIGNYLVVNFEQDLIDNFNLIKDYANKNHLKVSCYDKDDRLKIREIDMELSSSNITSMNFVTMNQDNPKKFAEDLSEAIYDYKLRYGPSEDDNHFITYESLNDLVIEFKNFMLDFQKSVENEKENIVINEELNQIDFPEMTM